VRGSRFCAVLVRSAALRLPPVVDPGALQPLERGLRRGHLLRGRRLHVPPGRGPGFPDRPSKRNSARSPSRTYEGSIGKARTEELAVMVDTFRPLQLTTHGVRLEDEKYPFSWLG